MNLKTKLLKILGYAGTVTAYESWCVRWTSYEQGHTLALLCEQMEIFPTREDAITFVESLEAARKLCKDSRCIVTIRKNS